jgi:PPP family 3-phenylpropionic acid transporter
VLLWLQPLHAVTFGLVWVAALAYTKEHAPAHVLATAQSLFSIATGIGAGVGMLAWGALYAAGKGPLVFTIAAAVAGAGGALSLFLAPARAPTSELVESSDTVLDEAASATGS